MKDRISQESLAGGCAECNGNLNEKITDGNSSDSLLKLMICNPRRDGTE